MTLEIEPELGVPLAPDIAYIDLRERVQAACNSVLELELHGLEIDPVAEDKDVAAGLATDYARDSTGISKKMTSKRVAAMRPASIVLAAGILEEFSHSVVQSATQIRHLVMNKLLLESENPDPRIRIRALELLGKVSDVGLFTEKSEVTVTHQSSEDLRARLRSKLAKLVNPVEVDDAPIIDGEALDVDMELGLKEANDG